MIPTFSAAGERLRDYSAEAILKLEKLAAVRAQRNFRGEIVSARFRVTPRSRRFPNARLGSVKYTRVEQVGDHKLTVHKFLPYRMCGADTLQWEQVEHNLKKLFHSVLLSVLEPDPPTPARGAKVVSIERPTNAVAAERLAA